MKSGMLWLDDDPRSTLLEKAVRAARFYYNKYGRRPDTCLVHRSAFAGKEDKRQTVEVGKVAVTIRPHHPMLADTFWVGSDDFETRAVPR